jgi:uncharacterized protein
MNAEQIINKAEILVKQRMSGYDSGHDWWHIARVRNLAKHINEKEELADPFLLDMAALFHDYVDSKFSNNNHKDGYEEISMFLLDNGLDKLIIRLTDIIKNVSFSSKNNSGNIHDPVLMIIQDADKLDAMGAIGIARAFNYGGFRNNLIYSSVENENINSTIKHFYDKLLILKSMMNTQTGRIIADERHKYLEQFLKQFYKEWNFNSI